MAPIALIAVFVFAFGLVIGSFLNVCIVRIPEGKSIVAPPSACPKCGKGIRPYDNIPVISYLLLGGKCRSCKTRISPIYPIVELLTALLFLACFWAFGLSVYALKWVVFSAIMVVLVFTDLRERILPDVVNFTGLGAGLVLSLFTRPEDGMARWIVYELFNRLPSMRVASLLDAALGALAGGGMLWMVMEFYFLLRKREGMGLGDVKMMLMAGSFLGINKTLLTIFAGSVLGSVLGAVFILTQGEESDYELPFGSFLGMAALLIVFFGPPVIAWWFSKLM